MAYHTIVFQQNEDAREALDILDQQGEDAAIEHLAQWDNGGESEHSPQDDEPWGSSDQTYEKGDYILSYNTRLDYISLTRVTKD